MAEWLHPNAKALVRAEDNDPYSVAPNPSEDATMTKPENTTKRVHDDPMSLIAEAMLFGGSGAIERMERAGQEQLLASSVLPTNTGGDDAFIALGFQFGAPVDGDPLFRETALPAGWKRQGSDHDMWSYVVDERGIKRVGVFYKAAHYDRRAYMHLIKVGSDVANNALYGETPITAESLQLSRLTPDELKDFASTLDRMERNIKESPDIYGKYAERLAAARASGSSDRE